VQALGGFVSKGARDAYWESDEYLCTYAIGHVLTLFAPEDIDPAYKSWRLEHLPIIPKTFQLKPIAGHEKRIDIIAQLMARADVGCVINACDAAREGELIFRELLQYNQCRKWVRRLWLQSMTTEAIRTGFKTLRDGVDLDGLAASAACRAQSDWLIGMNATRAFSKRLASGRDAAPWSVGRVQTPTLALLVRRELEILGHVPRPFFRIVARFDVPGGQGRVGHDYEGTWFDPQFKKDELKPDLRDDRIHDGERARAIVAALKAGAPAKASETREESLRHAPYLFSLTGLQKYMASRYKWNSKRTLEAAQRCYEQHKVLTYPRTSSVCLPSDYRGEVDRLFKWLTDSNAYGAHAQYLIDHGRRNDKRTFDDSGVTDHFAIIPTGKHKSLGGDDEKLFDAVVRRFIATFYPPAVYDKVRRITVVGAEQFRTGPIETLTEPGWLAVYEREAEDGEAKLPALIPGKREAEGVAVTVRDAKVKDEMTKPPPRISEAQLLSLMEHAGRQVESEELAKALMSAEGLGTAATRADIIQNLKHKGYIDDALRPLVKGIQLISVLERLGAERLTSAELTAGLELQLSEVEAGKRAGAAFMNEIVQYVTDVTNIARDFRFEDLFAPLPPIGRCPVCNKGNVVERAAAYGCSACEFQMSKDVCGRYLDRVHAAMLVVDGKTPVLDGFRTKAGKGYEAAMTLKGGVLSVGDDAVPSSPDRRSGATTGVGDPSADARRPKGPGHDVGRCPIHKDACNIIETRTAYVCETRLKEFAGGNQQPTGFMLQKTLCGRTFSAPELAALIKDGVTPELKGFKSKAGKPFAAKLRLLPNGTSQFEFAPRPNFQKDRRRDQEQER
jgi:DNA topoisomerase-3